MLVQAGLIYHHTTHEGRTSYEANPRNAYHLVRSGRIIDDVSKRFGKVAAAVITQILLLGHASVEQLRRSSRTYSQSAKVPSNTSDGDAGSSLAQVNGPSEDQLEVEVDNALGSLIKHGLICRLRQAYLETEADNRQRAEEKVYSQPVLSTAKGTKAKEEHAARVEQVLEKQKDSHIHLTRSALNGGISQKRKASELDESTHQSKKFKLTNAVSTQVAGGDPMFLNDEEDHAFHNGLIVRPNYARIIVFFRNSRLLALVEKTYGKSVSRTYEAVLNQLEPDQRDTVTDSHLGAENERSRDASKEINESRLAQDLAHPESNVGRPSSQWTGINGYVNGNTHRLATETRSHLEILCEPPFCFLSHSLEYPEKYVIEYSDLAVYLRNTEIFSILSARFDKYAMRVVQVLLDKGKTDEKYLQEIVLMSAKELRQTLAMLQRAGFVELQEVPREAQRQPSRTIYLWFYDPDRVRKMLLEDTYKCMARCMHRMKVEKEKVKPTIEKSERSDVKGQEEKLLPKAELEVLKGWRSKETWLLAEVGRLDELIFVLRDF